MLFRSALQCNVPCSPEPGTSGVSFMCVTCGLLLWLSHLWTDFGPCVVSGPVGGCTGLKVSHTGCLPEMQWHQTVAKCKRGSHGARKFFTNRRRPIIARIQAGKIGGGTSVEACWTVYVVVLWEENWSRILAGWGHIHRRTYGQHALLAS